MLVNAMSLPRHRHECAVAIVVMPRPEATGLVVIRIGSRGRENVILHVAVARRRGVAKVTGSINGLNRQLVAARRIRFCA